MTARSPIFLAHVDAFTAEPFAGNPAGVCILNEDRDAAWMQHIASEVNHAETAFLREQPGGWNLRWFTPTVEVDLCGHATLASAHILYETGLLPPERKAIFQSKSGELTARKNGDWIELDFPADPVGPLQDDPGITAALGKSPIRLAVGKFDYLVELAGEAEVRELQPDLASMAVWPGRGVCVTAKADAQSPYDFVSRFFGPAVGIPEDPVTGSAHCMLAPYWAEQLGRQEMTGFQCSSRGGVVRVRLAGRRVILGGKAVTIAAGEIAPGAEKG